MNTKVLSRRLRFINRLIALLSTSIFLIVNFMVLSPSAYAASESEVIPNVEGEWSNSLQVNTSEGTIEGIVRNVNTLDDATTPVYAWLGIPYTKNPKTPQEVSQLRWKAPQPPEIRRGLLKTKVRMPQCPQPPDPDAFDMNGQIQGSEDCRYANIWRPKTIEKNLPVYVDIHGGGGFLGQGQDLAHIAAEHNVVAISFNYRLSLLGIFNAPGLETGNPLDDSGNFAILDGLQLLEWVQQNATAFGGDPNLVTLGGYSAGGSFVWALMTSPLTQGRNLFHRAVINSVPIRTEINTVTDNNDTSRRLLTHYLYETDRSLNFDDASEKATQLHQMGESGSIFRNIDTTTLICLVNRIRADDLVDQCGYLRPLPEKESSLFIFPPNNDGITQPLVSEVQAVKNGDFEQVPVLMGATQQEAKFFTVGRWLIFDDSKLKENGQPSRQQFYTLFNQFDPDNPTMPLPGIGVPTAEFILPDSLPPAKYEKRQKIAGTIGTRLLTTLGANAAKSHVPIFVYRFLWKNQPKPFETVVGATHTGDLPFWLQTFEADGNEYQMQPVGFSRENRPGRIDLAKKMGVYFRNFLRNGDPNVGETPPRRWTQWRNAIFFKRMHFNASDNRADLVMGR
ncbi:carboxylesterase family protein [Acaryochloris sp. IP29b_bin.137]|uniref:carboxylesterase family protein n=1 Tax=Acaryochloris sp. IP29b_bin.137 TaxID=2969217 RepID=UPI002633F6D8|nr:carboxylesterase family protein [Acaryochloris sp. IP29b_bin.137]